MNYSPIQHSISDVMAETPSWLWDGGRANRSKCSAIKVGNIQELPGLICDGRTAAWTPHEKPPCEIKGVMHLYEITYLYVP